MCKLTCSNKCIFARVCIIKAIKPVKHSLVHYKSIKNGYTFLHACPPPYESSKMCNRFSLQLTQTLSKLQFIAMLQWGYLHSYVPDPPTKTFPDVTSFPSGLDKQEMKEL